MYDTFECHFKPNQKSQSDMVDPVEVALTLIFQKRLCTKSLSIIPINYLHSIQFGFCYTKY